MGVYTMGNVFTDKQCPIDVFSLEQSQKQARDKTTSKDNQNTMYTIKEIIT
jgi:hypothetical protein